MRLHRLRIELDDAPGHLGRAAAALGALGVNILDVDVHGIAGDRRDDELLVDLTVPLDLPAVEAALRDVGCEVVDIRPSDPHELIDAGTRCLELAGGLIADQPVSDDRMGELVRALVRADLSWVGPVPGMSPSGVAARALESGAPAQGRDPVKRSPRGDDVPWSLAIPFSAGERRRVLVLVRRRPRFSFTETARAQAFLRLGAVVAGTVTQRVVSVHES